MEQIHNIKYFHTIIHLNLIFIITLALSCTVCTGCARNTTPISRTDFYFDTVIQITLYATADA